MSKHKLRVTQHKETSDKTEVKKARELRAENQKLKRQLSRLRREISKGVPAEPDFEEPPEVEAPPTIKPVVSKCCENPNLSALVFGKKTLIVCTNCGYRKMETKNE